MFSRLVKFRKGDKEDYEHLHGESRAGLPSTVRFTSLQEQPAPPSPGSVKAFAEGMHHGTVFGH